MRLRRGSSPSVIPPARIALLQAASITPLHPPQSSTNPTGATSAHGFGDGKRAGRGLVRADHRQRKASSGLNGIAAAVGTVRLVQLS